MSNETTILLPSDFSKDPVRLVALEDTGATLIVHRRGHKATTLGHKEINVVDFVNPEDNEVLENKFTMEWQNVGNTTQILFKGTGGSLVGQSGNPGVLFLEDEGIQIDLLLKRTDGSFYLEADDDFFMIVCRSKANGSPDVETLQASQFPKEGVKLAHGYWHSVPFPMPGGDRLHLTELVAKTDQNATVNVHERTGAPLCIPIDL